MICRKATFTVSVSAVTLSNAILRLHEHKNPDFVLEKPENKGFRPQKRTKTPILCSKGLKMRVLNGKSAQKPRFCARGWLPRAQQRLLELSTTRHEPCGVHLAAVRQAIDCRNLPPRPTCRSYYRACRRGATAEELPQKATAGTPVAGYTARRAYYLAMGPAPSGRVIRM